MRRQRPTFTLTHNETGQSITAIVVARSGGGKFMKVWQGTGWEQRLGNLHGASVKVLFHLVMVAKWCNQVPGPSETALSLGIKQPNASRSYSELMRADFLRKGDGSYWLSPLFCWKGSEEQYENAVKELAYSPRDRLTIMTNSAVKGLI